MGVTMEPDVHAALVWSEISQGQFDEMCVASKLKKLDGDTLITWCDNNGRAILKHQRTSDDVWHCYKRKK